MSILVDHEIRTEIKKGALVIEPYDDKLIQPNSYDVRLADSFSWHDPSTQVIDPYKSETVLQGLVHVRNESIVIHPKQFVPKNLELHLHLHEVETTLATANSSDPFYFAD